MTVWWIATGVPIAFLIQVSYRLLRDRRENGEWLWTAWREEQTSAKSRPQADEQGESS